ncbi:MAG: transglycosylase domain-containing protein [Pikeienuella sp.]
MSSETKTPNKAQKKKSTPQRSWFGRAWRYLFWWLVRLGLRVALFVGLIIGAATGYYYVSLPAHDALFDGRSKGSVTLLDRSGDIFAWRGAQYGGEVTLNTVSPYLTKAIIATEDRRFYSHPGIDPLGLARAMVANVRAGRFVQGGSTLTQQVAKNVFLTSEKTLERKLKEVPIALAMEMKYGKDAILSIYLNRVYLGAGATGFEAASQRYFAKSAREVNLAESAMLAGLLKAPSRLAPTSNMGRAQGRAGVIVNAMLENGDIDAVEARRAIANPAELSKEAARKTGAHFADWVMETGPAYLTTATAEDVLISTTFDPTLQRAAEDALAHVFDTRVKKGSPAEAAIVIMDHNGTVRAIVGGRDARANTFNRATQALRQTGSAFKPIVYATAMEAGFSIHDRIEDRPLTMDDHGRKWSPKNYDGQYRGQMTLTDALANSINTVAVRLSEKVGRDRVRAMAVELGLTTPIAEGPAVALGVSEATLLEMTGVYAAFANGGRRAAPLGVRTITVRGDDAPIMSASDTNTGQMVISPNSAARMTEMMQQVISSGTGRRAALPDRAMAGKTGTTQGARDAWFIGYTADYVIGVWMGKDDNAPLIGVTGGGLPAAIWRETAQRAHDGLPARALNTAVSGSSSRGNSNIDDDDTLVESIFKDVFRSLGGGDGNSQQQKQEERIDR